MSREVFYWASLNEPHTSKKSVRCTMLDKYWPKTMFFWIVLGSPQTTKTNEFTWSQCIGWIHQIALCHQPSHRGFTAKVTDTPNVVCMVNHAMEDLQWRLLILHNYMVMVNRIYSIELQILLVALSHENAEMERAREREERLRWWKEQYRTTRVI